MTDDTSSPTEDTETTDNAVNSCSTESFKQQLESGDITSADVESLLVDVVNENIVSEDEFASLLAQVMIDTTNSGTLRGEEIADEIGGLSTHSWLQRELFYGLIVPLVEEMADTPTDGRNKDAVDSCQSMIEATK